MPASGGRSGPRSGLYSNQRFTNWNPHDPHWSEVEALPKRLAPRAEVARQGDDTLAVFDRALTPGFARTCSVEDVVALLGSVPFEYLLGLSGVYLMAGTSKQRRLRTLTFGLYHQERIFLFPVPLEGVSHGWECSSNPSNLKRFTRFGAQVSSSRGGRSNVTLDEVGLRRFYLYDVLLHELGHHVDRLRRTGDPERYARWFAEFQQSHLTHPSE